MLGRMSKALINKDVPIKERTTHGARNVLISACKRTENDRLGLFISKSFRSQE